jgi:hypothetical protein
MDRESAGGFRTLVRHELEDRLDALEQNGGLEAVTPAWDRIRWITDRWRKVQVITGEFVHSDIDRDEAVETLRAARKIHIRPASTNIWADYEHEGRF